MRNRFSFRKLLVKLFTVLFFTMAFFSAHAAEETTQTPSPQTSSITGKYLFEITSVGTEIGPLNQPADITISDAGDMFIADTVNNRVVVFDNDGKAKSVIGKEGTGAGELKEPMALAIDSKRKKIFVADSSNNRIQVFGLAGNFILTIDLNKDKLADEKMVRPIGIAVSQNGTIYVSDADNNFIRTYSQDGKFLSKFGTFGAEDGQLCVPVGLFVDTNNKVYVVDMNNARLQVFDERGKFLLKAGSKGDTKGDFIRPKDVCVDKNENIYVSDGGNLVVQSFDKNGKFSGIIGSEKDVDSQFASPFGVAVKDNHLYVVDRWRNSIRVFEITTVQKLKS